MPRLYVLEKWHCTLYKHEDEDKPNNVTCNGHGVLQEYAMTYVDIVEDLQWSCYVLW